MKQATGIVNQIIIYSKNWYKQSENGVVEDVRQIISKYCELELDHVSEVDAKGLIADAFAEYVTGFDLKEGLHEILGLKWFGWAERFQRDPYDVMIGKLGIILGEYVNMDEKMDFTFTEKIEETACVPTE